ncbi:putative proline-rich receptor-like protein kinase PERK2 [Iris pallida]|uniref:Proline-rich receptor-like protein kinase PERK2 n=1 Tax=Iris pallida TaxID=29817 RepID=A0AAX6I2T1_IRIPA|nr:putative proline-rich receptor-like protein kinase PERK2 [Iris pallida]
MVVSWWSVVESAVLLVGENGGSGVDLGRWRGVGVRWSWDGDGDCCGGEEVARWSLVVR